MIVRTEAADCRIALLGLPDDTGVRLNGGRPGAAQGPSAFRAALASYGAVRPCFAWPLVFDAGDVVPAGDDLGTTHQRVSEAVGALLHAGLFPVGIGGGHDLTFPFVRAVAEHTRTRGSKPMVGVYFDAHLDVREQDGSGMPFRRLLDGGYCGSLHVHGLDTFSNSREHVDWFQSRGGTIEQERTSPVWPEGDLFVSLDLDVIDQSAAPGVSAMNPCGWSAERACRWVHAAGRCERVRCFDLMELCPPHDEGGRTARLAARLFCEFARGYAERGHA